MQFEWDSAKAAANQTKHHVDFEEAASVFGDPFELIVADPASSASEERWVSLGTSVDRRLLVVVYVERQGRVRIISARQATSRERRTYEERRR